MKQFLCEFAHGSDIIVVYLALGRRARWPTFPERDVFEWATFDVGSLVLAVRVCIREDAAGGGSPAHDRAGSN